MCLPVFREDCNIVSSRHRCRCHLQRDLINNHISWNIEVSCVCNCVNTNRT
uniref:Uncharacterized protein n=1 Tax=uncultured marine virus TaxID=186617 RepID=A0A0F7L7M7_9VIRU|nr:hypothetical protein [uncultured marine virus]